MMSAAENLLLAKTDQYFSGTERQIPQNSEDG